MIRRARSLPRSLRAGRLTHHDDEEELKRRRDASERDAGESSSTNRNGGKEPIDAALEGEQRDAVSFDRKCSFSLHADEKPTHDSW